MRVACHRSRGQDATNDVVKRLNVQAAGLVQVPMRWLRPDVRPAARQLARTPGLTLVTILTLALGIGANTTIFSVLNGVLLRPLGYPDADRVMFITSRFPSMGFDQFWISPPEYLELQEWSQSFSEVGAFTTGEVNLAAGDRPQRARSANVDAELLRALGVPAFRGRHFDAPETRAGGPEVAILSHEIWQSAFSGRDLVGQAIDVDGIQTEVLGIMPPGFDVMDHDVEILRPLRLDPANRENRGNHALYLMGRLADGVTMGQALAELDTLYARWAEQFGHSHHPTPDGHPMQMEPAQAAIVGGAVRAIWVL